MAFFGIWILRFGVFLLRPAPIRPAPIPSISGFISGFNAPTLLGRFVGRFQNAKTSVKWGLGRFEAKNRPSAPPGGRKFVRNSNNYQRPVLHSAFLTP